MEAAPLIQQVVALGMVEDPETPASDRSSSSSSSDEEDDGAYEQE